MKIKPQKNVSVLEVHNDKERLRRQAAVDFAVRSVGLEGFMLSPLAETLSAQYVNGEITSGQGIQTLNAHYKTKLVKE